jgi:hypothetical protein
MTITTQACASGCTLRAEHLTTCLGECRGCLPRPVEQGVLCAWCWQRLQAVVVDVPAMVLHLREIGRLDMAAAARPLSDDAARGGDPTRSTVLPGAYLAADELKSTVAFYALLVVGAHPARLKGPNLRAAATVSRWLTPHLEWCAEQRWVPAMLRDLSRELSTLRARWPMPADVERARSVPGMRCPRCDQVSLEYSPPTWERMPFRVSCQNQDCARVFNEDEWDRLVGLVARAERKPA